MSYRNNVAKMENNEKSLFYFLKLKVVLLF